MPFRSSSQQYSLESFSFRFVRGSSMRPSSTREADLSLGDIAAKAALEGGAVAQEGGDGALLDSAVEGQVSVVEKCVNYPFLAWGVYSLFSPFRFWVPPLVDSNFMFLMSVFFYLLHCFSVLLFFCFFF